MRSLKARGSVRAGLKVWHKKRARSSGRRGEPARLLYPAPDDAHYFSVERGIEHTWCSLPGVYVNEAFGVRRAPQ